MHDDHQFKEAELKSVGEFFGQSTNLHVRSHNEPELVSNVWRVRCKSEYKQYCHVGNTAQQCQLGLFQDSDFAEDLEDSKSTSGGTMRIWQSHICSNKLDAQEADTCVSHSSIGAETISLDAGLRMDGDPALDLWDLVIEVLHSDSN